MDIIINALPLIIAGGIAGFLAGLLGIGGGIVTIPALFIVFTKLEVPFEWRMHAAIGTSLAIIVATNCSSAWAHNKKEAVDWNVVKTWWFTIVIGAVSGSYFATYLKTTELVYFFATLAAFLAIKMLLPIDKWKLGSSLPSGVFRFSNPTLIGFFSSVMGIGGGSFSVPYMTLYNIPIRRAVGTASVIGLVLSFAGTIGYIISGQGIEGMPDGMLGFIHGPSAIIVSLAAVITAPFGAKAAHWLPHKVLSILFGLFLIGATLRLINAV
ncbi:sulfite exporter TauE/SafE family protein [Kordiimonas aquimaris]|uniref:sulfite exporter TauE/SafE family protein n=1 Tax=Kordiimonas aquimaris TaxID=707591 RepID=UPI0021D36880|nr:sulfite exporter TauE/SafE family protein [Kordiimonas aquimaris]